MPKPDTPENVIARKIVNVALHIHRTLGPGLLESAYEVVLAHELRKAGLRCARQVPIPMEWDGLRVDLAFRADLVVGGVVLIELKSTEDLAAIASRAAGRAGITLDGDAALAIAKAAQGTPRIALRLMARLRDLLAARACRSGSRQAVHEVLDLLGLDTDGLGPRHRETLSLIRQHGRVGRSRLAGLLRVSRGTVRDLIEPPLFALGLLRPTPRGLAIA